MFCGSRTDPYSQRSATTQLHRQIRAQAFATNGTIRIAEKLSVRHHPIWATRVGRMTLSEIGVKPEGQTPNENGNFCHNCSDGENYVQSPKLMDT